MVLPATATRLKLVYAPDLTYLAAVGAVYPDTGC